MIRRAPTARHRQESAAELVEEDLEAAEADALSSLAGDPTEPPADPCSSATT